MGNSEDSLSDRVADAITRFAGSMYFVYLHVLWFGVWMLFVEKSPWASLTLVVSLEAIFLSTFVMIGQNRSSERDRAEQQYDHSVDRQSLALLKALHEHIHGPNCTECFKDDEVTE